MKIGKRAARLVREAAVLGYVNGVHSVTSNAVIPPDLDIAAEVVRAARTMTDLYPVLGRADFPDGDPVIAHLDALRAAHLEAVRALINGGPD